MKEKVIRCLIGTVALTAVFGASTMIAGAQDSETRAKPPSIVERFDQDGDGLLSADEFPGGSDEFSQLDSDGDGYLDDSEIPHGPPHGGPGPGDMMTELDEDGDGLLSASEFPGPDDQFTTLDTDGDGYLSSEELAAGRPGPPKGGRGGFDSDDADKDGMVSQEEFSGPADMFAHMDTNGDGYISRDEVRSGPAGPGR